MEWRTGMESVRIDIYEGKRELDAYGNATKKGPAKPSRT